MDKQKLVSILTGGLQSEFLPIGLPLNQQQKQWLGGLFAGLQSQSATSEGSVSAGKPLLIIYGTQTGNSESVAEDTAAAAKAFGLAPMVMDMDDVDMEMLANTERLLVVTSTYGEGEMPDNAHLLWEAISEDGAPKLDKTFYSVLALGDSSYDDFCLAGKEWDERLHALGATSVGERVDCDVDFEEPAQAWMETVLPVIAEKGSDNVDSGAAPVAGASSNKSAKSKYNRKNPLPATLKTKRVLTAAESSKEIVHYEFDLGDSGETYIAGDALNIVPRNRDDLVEEFLAYFDEEANDTVRNQLLNELEIRTPSKDLVKLVAEKGSDANADSEELNRLLANNDPEAIDDFLWGKDSFELIRSCANHNITLNEFIATCKPLVARAYSISSSIKKHENEVHLTIGSVRYKNNDREQNGVASTFLADIANEGDTINCYFSPNKSFKIPQDGDLPIIMVGPGTGIAPFRSFLEAREMTGAKGDNWLFFGDRNASTDFIYRDEVEAMQSSGLLTKLSLAFSRDQSEKIYVQDRMKQEGAELFAWLERGGYFYICGDAYRMAKDVDKALHEIIAEHGNMSEDDATAYVNNLKKEKRYVRDVY